MANLDKLFSPSQWNGDGKSSEQVLGAFRDGIQKALTASRTVIALKDVDYGSQKLDIWGSNVNNPTHVFVYFHGGFWQEGCKEDVAPLIDLVVNGAGIPCVSVGYDMATRRPLREVLQQALDAFHFLEQRFRNAVFTLAGHSIGGHMACYIAANVEDARRIKQVMAIGGIFDLTELVHTCYGRDMRLSETDAKELSVSPKKLADNMHRRRITLFIAEHDTPKFHEQTNNLQHGIIEAAGNVVEAEKLLIRGDDHFTIITSMTDRFCDPARHLLRRLRFF